MRVRRRERPLAGGGGEAVEAKAREERGMGLRGSSSVPIRILLVLKDGYRALGRQELTDLVDEAEGMTDDTTDLTGGREEYIDAGEVRTVEMERCDVLELLELRPVKENHDEYVAERVVMVLDEEDAEE